MVALSLALSATGTAWAQDPGKAASRERELLRRAQTAQKQAEDAKAASEEARLKAESDAKQAAAKATEAGAAVGRERRRAAELQAEVTKLQGERDALQKERDALTAKLAAAESGSATLSGEVASLRAGGEACRADVARRQAAHQAVEDQRVACEARGLQLSQLFRELMERHRDVSVWQAIKRAEPFTGLERAKVDALLESYRDRADNLSAPAQNR